jgi:hypothetical protein
MGVQARLCHVGLLLLVLAVAFSEYSLISGRRARNMHVELRSRAQRWQRRQEDMSSYYWHRVNGTARLSYCLPDSVEAIARTRFAIVSLLSVDDGFMYTESALKLARSVRMWLKPAQMDMVLMVVHGFGFSMQVESGLKLDQMLLRQAGWTSICSVPSIQHPDQRVSSRFHDARLYSKLNLWGLVQYEALLYLDLDTLVVREPTRLFTVFVPRMQRLGLELAAVQDRPESLVAHFNAGVLLVSPRTPVAEMIHSIGTVDHEQLWAEQGLLNVRFHERWMLLPFIYNANVYSKMNEPELWTKHSRQITIVHYTVAKGWHSVRDLGRTVDVISSFMCWGYDVDDFCQLWDRL